MSDFCVVIDPEYLDTLINPDVYKERECMEKIGKIFHPLAEAIIFHEECEIVVKYVYVGEEVFELRRVE